jgi:hypothetical protein
MNFGETLSYWYLRLNGFFPLSDFVLHRAGIDDRPSADTDLLAIRFPYVFEVIGGQKHDWDSKRFERWGLSLNEPLALIVEVKTGVRIQPPKAWRPERLRAGLNRFGIFEQAQVGELSNLLRNSSGFKSNSWVVAKLLVTSSPTPNDRWHNLTLGEAEDFIRRRVATYRDEKHADRMFFPNELMQYLAWKGSTEQPARAQRQRRLDL